MWPRLLGAVFGSRAHHHQNHHQYHRQYHHQYHRQYHHHSHECQNTHLQLDILHDAGMDETYGTYVDEECFDIHDYDDTDDDTDDDTNDDTDDDADDCGRGNLYPIKPQGSRTLSGHA